MSEPQKPEVKPRSISRYVLLGAASLIFIATFSLLSPILLSFLLILLISLAVNPLVLRMRALMGGRKGPAIIIALSVALLVTFTGWAFFGPMRTSITTLSVQLPEYWTRLQKPFIKMEQQAARSEEKVQSEVATETADANRAAGKPEAAKPRAGTPAPTLAKDSDSLRSSLRQTLQTLADRCTAVAFNAAQITFVLITVFFGVTFTLMNPRPIFRGIFSLIPEPHHAKALVIGVRIAKFLPNWALSTLVAMLTVGLLVFLLMWRLLGFSDALVLGLIAGVFEAIPYLGPMLSAVPALLFALGRGGLNPFWVLLAYLGVQLLENNVIAPLIMARGMKLHSVAVIFAMLLCVAAFGVLGVLVAAPLVAIVEILHEELYRERYLPSVTDAQLDRLARNVLGEKQPPVAPSESQT